MTDTDFTPMPATPSATLLLVRDGDNGLEVLMMKRSETMKFAPGIYVFPGGKVDLGDASDIYHPHLPSGACFDDMDHRIAAVRELFEESGILYAADRDSLKGVKLDRSDFIKALQDTKAVMSLDKLIFFAHWITPIQAKRRFDTRFYLAPFRGRFDGLEDGSEMIDTLWISPAELLARWEQDDIPIMFPTRLNLMRLSEATSLDEAIKQAEDRTVVPVLPTFTFDRETGKKSISIPVEAGYQVCQSTDKDISAEARMMRGPRTEGDR